MRQKGFFAMIGFDILIHASARDATAKSYKIGNNFTVLVRKFVQIFDILILHISIFLEKQEQYFYFCSANLPGFLRCFRFAPTFSYIVCQNLRLVDFSVETTNSTMSCFNPQSVSLTEPEYRENPTVA